MNEIFQTTLRRINKSSKKEYEDKELRDAAELAGKKNLILKVAHVYPSGALEIKKFSGEFQLSIEYQKIMNAKRISSESLLVPFSLKIPTTS